MSLNLEDLALFRANNNSCWTEPFSGAMLFSVCHISVCSAVWLPLFKMSDVALLVNTEMCVNCCKCLLL